MCYAEGGELVDRGGIDVDVALAGLEQHEDGCHGRDIRLEAPFGGGSSLTLRFASLGFEPSQRCCQLGSVSNAELGQHVGDVPLDCLAGKEQRLSDLGIARARGREPSHLALPLGQSRERIGAAGRRSAPPGPDAERPEALLRQPLLRCRVDFSGENNSGPKVAAARRPSMGGESFCRVETGPERLDDKLHSQGVRLYRASRSPTPCSTSPECTRKRPATRLRTNCSCGLGRAGSSCHSASAARACSACPTRASASADISKSSPEHLGQPTTSALPRASSRASEDFG